MYKYVTDIQNYQSLTNVSSIFNMKINGVLEAEFEGISVSIVYVPSDDQVPARIEIDLSFEKEFELADINLEASAGLGDLAQISVERASIAVTSGVTAEAKFGVILGPNQDEELRILGSVKNVTSGTLDAKLLVDDVEYLLTINGRGDALTDWRNALSAASVPNIESTFYLDPEAPLKTLVIRFDPIVAEVEVRDMKPPCVAPR